MDAINPQLHSHLVSQGLIRGSRPALRPEAPAPSGPAETFRPGETRAPGLVPNLGRPAPGAAAAPPEFAFPSDADSIARMDALRRGGLADELKQVRKDLKAQRKELREGGAVADKARVHGGLQDVDTALDRLELAHRASRWDDVASAVDGEVSPTYRSYFLHGQSSVSEMKEVLQTARSLEDPASPMRLEGNSVQPLVRGEIWKTKMQRLEEAAREPMRDGRPLEIDAEYYELSSPHLLDKLARASRGGANVRVLMDPGQLSRMGGTPDATSLASRLNTVRRLEEGSGGRAAVQFFANSEVLGGKEEIMHRKLLRVGDGVVFGGMNANEGSGENVDFGMEIHGPAAGKFVDTFRRDVELSRGRSAEAIYGRHLEDLRQTENVIVQPRAVLDLLEAQISGGPRPGEAREARLDRVLESASFQGLRPSDLAQIPDGDGDGAVSPAEERAFLLAGRGDVALTERGRNLLADGLGAAVERMNGSRNQEGLQAIQAPRGEKVGTETLAIGDSSVERQALVLHAIDSAERSIKVSAFVLNEDLARLLVEKRDRMQAQGRPFDVQVVLDPGVYPFGGSPNEKAHRFLEDHGVEVRWAALDRSDPHHDRKVHAKLLVTDQMMVAGSTNFSHKGLRDNWELSDVTFFRGDEASRADQQKVEADFQHLWERESLAIDTRAVAERRHGTAPGSEAEFLRDDTRTRVLRRFLRGIGNLEEDLGRRVADLEKSDPVVAYTAEQRVREGEARGYALLQAVGDERLQALRHASPAWHDLQRLRSGEGR